MEILKKTARLGVSNSQGTQNKETTTQRCFTEMIDKKPLLKCSSTRHCKKNEVFH